MTRLRLRRWWFRVHQWLGVGLAVLVIPLSLSGAALVWHDALDRLLHPGRYATSGTALLGADAYVAAARARLAPGERIATL
ncbi:PepSY domain-containing protein, partial [Sphingomonas bacterium]|uniref:PepSY domain-containing protein n=1 Tax=Sphingomonas bacterium TaxID=1895847 RepID=UPI001576B12F